MTDIVRNPARQLAAAADRPVPQRPAGRHRDCTLILSVLGIVLAFPLSVLLALARISPWRLLRWPATALVYVVRGVPLLMVILWVYFLVPLLIGRNVSGFTTMLCTLVIYEGAYLSEVVRAGIQALPRGQMEAARALGHSYLGAMWYGDPAAGALQHAAEHAEPVRLDHQGNDAGLRHQRARADLRGEPDQQPAADQALPGVLHPGDHLFRRLLEPDAAGAMAGAAHRHQAARRGRARSASTRAHSPRAAAAARA